MTKGENSVLLANDRCIFKRVKYTSRKTVVYVKDRLFNAEVVYFLVKSFRWRPFILSHGRLKSRISVYFQGSFTSRETKLFQTQETTVTTMYNKRSGQEKSFYRYKVREIHEFEKYKVFLVQERIRKPWLLYSSLTLTSYSRLYKFILLRHLSSLLEFRTVP